MHNILSYYQYANNVLECSDVTILTYHFYFKAIEFSAKLKGKSCYKYSYGLFDNLKSAEESCSIDVKCKGIYQSECDTDNFSLCKVGFNYEDAPRDCVLEKIGIQKYLIT